jgi:DNA replication factor GINS
MASESFSFESLSKQEAVVRKSPRLTRVEPTFWDQLWEYLDELETQALKAHAENPAARRSILLSDELRNAMRKAEAVWEARQRKITFFAMKIGRHEKPARPENIMAQEVPFFEKLVATFKEHHAQLLRPKPRRGTAPAQAPPTGAAKAGSAAATATAAKAPAGASQNAASAGKPDGGHGTPAEGIATVRALEDIPPFVGLDAKTYRLKKGEVATIPQKMAEILRKNGKVAPVS